MLRCIMNAHYGGTANCGQDLFSNAVLGTETSRRRVVQYRSSVLLQNSVYEWIGRFKIDRP